jgi:outer membrane protein assembly factor BamB
MKGLITFVALGIFTAASCGAEKTLDWPRFRGPNGSGIAEGQKPPVEFGPDKNLKWKVPAPGGLSSPIVAGDKLVITAFEGGKLYTIAYNRADGKEAWRAEAPVKQLEPYHKTEGSPAASTPTTDGELIVSYFGSCGLVCYDLSGKTLWQLEMPPAEVAGDFGSGVSPILVDDTVILVRDQVRGSKIVALDVATGKVKWEKERQSPTSYGTPVVWDTPDGKQVVAIGHARIIGYDLKTGAETWSVQGMPSAPCTSPIAAEASLIFAGWSPGGPDDKSFQLPSFDALLKMADATQDGFVSREKAAKTFMKDMFNSFDANKDGKISRDEWETVQKFVAEGKNSAFALKTGGSGDVTQTHVLWKKTKGLPYIASAIVYGGQVVMVKDGGLVTAYDAKTGKELYLQERVASQGKYYASPVAANGHIYFTALDDGAVTVLKAGAEKPTVVVKNPKLGERTAATPAIADDTIYIRTAGHLYAFAEKK